MSITFQMSDPQDLRSQRTLFPAGCARRPERCHFFFS